jgi:predicted Zn-dependent protease
MRPTPATAALWAVLLAVLVGGLLWALPRLAGPLAGQVPLQWEQALGERMMAHLAEQQPFCDAAPGEDALGRLTERLLAGSDWPIPVRVRVSPQPAVNAFALPGGNIVLLRGLLETARSPEEVAGVLAHEIAHALERHPLRGALRAAGIGLVFRALAGNASGLEDAAARGVETLLLRSYTRADESAADRRGLALLERAGLDGSALADLLERLDAGEGRGAQLPSLLSTHPLSRERSGKLRRLAPIARPEAAPALSPADWAALRAICG